MIAIVAAVARENRVIGKDSKIPWKIPGELFYFKSLTLKSAVIMGRKTFESIGRPLPERLNIVLSREPEKHRLEEKSVLPPKNCFDGADTSTQQGKSFHPPKNCSAGSDISTNKGNLSRSPRNCSSAPVIFSPSLEKAIDTAKEQGYEKIFIIGGGSVYKEALDKNIPEKLYISEIQDDFEGDTFFPPLDEKKWTLSSSERVQNENEIPWIKKVYITI